VPPCSLASHAKVNQDPTPDIFTLPLRGPLYTMFIITKQYKVLEGRCEVDSLGFCRVFLGVLLGFSRGSVGLLSGFPGGSLHVGYDSV
jgi:hypothetical protein